MYFDPMYWLFLGPAMLLAFYAQIRVQTTFARFSRVGTQRVERELRLHDACLLELRDQVSRIFGPQ